MALGLFPVLWSQRPEHRGAITLRKETEMAKAKKDDVTELLILAERIGALADKILTIREYGPVRIEFGKIDFDNEEEDGYKPGWYYWFIGGDWEDCPGEHTGPYKNRTLCLAKAQKVAKKENLSIFEAKDEALKKAKREAF
jgi:hypothetical protein